MNRGEPAEAGGQAAWPAFAIVAAPDETTPLLNRAPTRARYIVMGFLCALSFLTYFDRVGTRGILTRIALA